jgi:hypothetical protein
VFLVNSRLGLVSATSFGSGREDLHLAEAHLLPKLRWHFAEFLNESSLTRLRILSSSTCVGLRYGRLAVWLEAFLGSLESAGLRPLRSSPSRLGNAERRICLSPLPTRLDRDVHHPDRLSSCVPPSLITTARWYRNVDLFPIDYASRPRLRDRLTLGGRTFPRKP